MTRPRLILASALLVAGASLGGSVASAETASPTPPPPASDATPSEEQLTAPGGHLVINGFFELNLSKDAVGKPLSISPDIWYAATDKLTLGIVHSSVGATGFLGGVGDALCLAGKDNGCAHVYPGVGLDARYRLQSPFTLDAGVYVRDFDPFQLALKLGIGARFRFGRIAVEIQPNLFIGLTERSPAAGAVSVTSTNKEVLDLPITGALALTPALELALQTGFSTPIDGAKKGYRIPLSLALRYAVSTPLSLGLAFSVPAIAGGDAVADGFDVRTLTLGVTYAR